MCIGIPMQVIEARFNSALCEGLGLRREVDTLLVGEQAPGTWLLVFLDSAREVLDAGEAHRISQALRALETVMSGQSDSSSLATLFADLIDRDPPKPPSLLARERADTKTGD